jgi:hypothetical protein
MSACIYRHGGKPCTCGKDKKTCRWYRAAWCVSWDVVCFVFGAVKKIGDHP